MNDEKTNFDSALLYTLAIVLILYLSAVTVQEYKTKHPTIDICSKLDYVKNGTMVVYPEVVNVKAAIEREGYWSIKDIGGNNHIYTNDSNGATCLIDAWACSYHPLYCMKMQLVIPVNYTTYETWRNE